MLPVALACNSSVHEEARTKDDALCAAIVAAGERSESFLACCVPYGHLQPLILDVDEFEPEVHACTHA